MRGQGSPSESALQSLLRGASKHDGPWPTISIWHGTADHTVDPSNMAAILAQWRGVHEVSQTPSCAAIVDGYSRKVWRNARGREIIEVYSIAGMGHGAPLKANFLRMLAQGALGPIPGWAACSLRANSGSRARRPV